MTHVFVTGGSGFLGGRLISTLRARGDRVLALARSERAVRRVESLGAEAIRGDLDDRRALDVGARGAHVVFHCAALAEEWDLILQNSRPGTRILLRSAGLDLDFVPTAVRSRLRFQTERSAALHRTDRVGTYGSLHFAEVI
jgi:uncharacterized protein YbjT (DUF2867 family)